MQFQLLNMISEIPFSGMAAPYKTRSTLNYTIVCHVHRDSI